MVLMLELVGIGVFGACLSALLCMIADCTPYEVPKIISFKQGLLSPRIIRSGNFSHWKSGIISHEPKRQMCRQRRNEPSKLSPQKLRSKVSRIYKHSGTSTCNLEHPNMSTKAVDNVDITEKYWNEGSNLATSPRATKKDCKYCGNVEKLKNTQSMDSKDNKMHLIVKSSVSKIKAALDCNKNHKFSFTDSNESRKSNETIVRIKKKRFILPKNLIVAKKLNNANAEEIENEPSKKCIDREFPTHGDYCYLEALRIKTNKADKIV